MLVEEAAEEASPSDKTFKVCALARLLPSLGLSVFVYKMGIWSCVKAGVPNVGCSDLRYSKKGEGGNKF